MDDHAWGFPRCGSNWTGYQCRRCGIWRRFVEWCDAEFRHLETEHYSRSGQFLSRLTPDCR